MLTLIVGLLCGLGAASVGYLGLDSPVWATILGILGFLVPSVIINLRIRKRLERVFEAVQGDVQEAQAQLQRKINRMQAKQVSGGKGLQKRLEKEQAEGVRAAMKRLDEVEKLKLWNFLAERQANTIRAQLCYQIQDFEAADRYFEKCLVLDPLTLAMKMVRLYKQDRTKELEKAFRKGVKRFKDESGAILYAVYSWILVKQDRIDEAIEVLNQGREKTDNETLQANWDALVNGRVRRFSNAGFGDEWYALHLERPKPVKVRQRGGRYR